MAAGVRSEVGEVRKQNEAVMEQMENEDIITLDDDDDGAIQLAVPANLQPLVQPQALNPDFDFIPTSTRAKEAIIGGGG